MVAWSSISGLFYLHILHFLLLFLLLLLLLSLLSLYLSLSLSLSLSPFLSYNNQSRHFMAADNWPLNATTASCCNVQSNLSPDGHTTMLTSRAARIAIASSPMELPASACRRPIESEFTHVKQSPGSSGDSPSPRLGKCTGVLHCQVGQWNQVHRSPKSYLCSPPEMVKPDLQGQGLG